MSLFIKNSFCSLNILLSLTFSFIPFLQLLKRNPESKDTEDKNFSIMIVSCSLAGTNFFLPPFSVKQIYNPLVSKWRSLNFRFNTTPLTTVTSSYVVPNNDLNYMDQPAAGIRNRIKNKIQVIDGNEYGTILSPYRSIQQEFEQSASYTEDINSLEVGFSFQNEINDDIISTFGHGVVSHAVGDPRFIS